MEEAGAHIKTINKTRFGRSIEKLNKCSFYRISLRRILNCTGCLSSIENIQYHCVVENSLSIIRGIIKCNESQFKPYKI
jgi:hypothetical protein